jgi:hypothetical protein
LTSRHGLAVYEAAANAVVWAVGDGLTVSVQANWMARAWR